MNADTQQILTLAETHHVPEPDGALSKAIHGALSGISSLEAVLADESVRRGLSIGDTRKAVIGEFESAGVTVSRAVKGKR